ncbi:MFS transporter [Pseudomarimonas salicorniae]|uniref:MFS transporter n=1 Tax=Pseudomarimonas salicorniae TaxID=2933270 RepID=A0ABT0GEB7_9GAMM|nr:MFS transporter [Lysobacter sp. CAU 1642]MCK7592350.1 MFS transporter [Lysobacter sp. CAU 1642]
MNAPALSPSLFSPGLRAPSIGAVALISMVAFEAIAVAAAMPTAAAALSGIGLYALAFGGTLAAGLVGMVLAGNDCDARGPRASMVWGLGLFGAGLLLAGVAGSMLQLVLGRVAQGLGGGMIGVAIYVAAARLYPGALRPRLFALFAAAWVLPAILGPGLAALIVESVGWRWVFLGVLALLPACAWLLLPALAPSVEAPRWPADARARLGWALLGAGAALSLHALGKPPLDLTGAGLGALCLSALALSAFRLLPPGTLRAGRGLPSVVLLRGLLASSFLAAEVFIPLWLTLHAGWSVAEAGLSLSLGALCWSLGSGLQARIGGTAKRSLALRGGLLLTALGIAGQLLAVSELLPAWSMPPLWALAGFGIGVAFPILSVLMLELAEPAEHGRAAAALQLSEALSHTALLAVIGIGFAALQAEQPVLAFSLVFAPCAALATLATLLSRRPSG